MNPPNLTIDFAPVSNGNRNSDAAAVAIRPRVNALRERVFQFILSQGLGGATAEEVQTALGLSGDVVRPRIWELRGCDRKRALPVRLFDSGRTRCTKSGCSATVWMAR